MSATPRDDLKHIPSGVPGPSKEVYYGWSDPGPKGRFEWVPVELLNVDHAYQRERVSGERVLAIASAWRWIACHALMVVRRPDGSMWVTDGQHRLLAARKRTSITHLPCLIFQGDGDKVAESDGFLRANTVRGPVDSYAKYRAALLRGDKDIVEIDAILTASGYRIISRGQTTNSVACVYTITTEYGQNPDNFRAVWPAVAAFAGGEHVDKRPLMALLYVERYLQRGGHGTITSGKLFDRIMAATWPAVDLACRKRQLELDKPGSKVWADGVIKYVLNQGSRSKIPSPYAGEG